MKKTITGFTIVELLIVVIVVAILASISIVAYAGIQNRANDSAIQSDLSNLAKKIQLSASIGGDFPAGGARRIAGVNAGDSTLFPGFSFSPAKSAYMSTVGNLFYCTGTEISSGQKVFRIEARSKSGNTFHFNLNDGVQNLGNVTASNANVCQGLDETRTWSYGYNPPDGGTWWSWTNG